MGYRDLLLSILCAGTFLLCNTGAKVSLTPGREWLMYLVYCGSVLSFWLFRQVCISNGLAVSSSIVDSLVTVISVLVGVFILQEQLVPRQYIGLGALFAGLYLIR